ATTEAVNAFPNKSSDRQGICPDGWVIPSDYDFNQLEEEIASHPDLYSSQTTPFAWDEMYKGMTGWRPGEGNTVQTWWGRSMKSSTKKVNNTITNGVSKEDGTGFNALLVGYLDGGTANYYGTTTDFWSGSAGSTTVAWRRHLYYGYSSAHRATYNKYYLFSVRCKK
ncbi:MAG: fibrobacter succinogenes major paralogous domain-containing protein, partial [Dysgonamonadaceae bacterium]|nr:fibrobacter succinogenes major paralogous domain-containing protein [Dysgonamonadaceae bacterium]